MQKQKRNLIHDAIQQLTDLITLINPQTDSFLKLVSVLIMKKKEKRNKNP